MDQFSALKTQMRLYYDNLNPPTDNPDFMAVKNKIEDRMRQFYTAGPSTPSVLLKSRLHQEITKQFEPVLFTESPFFYEMGLRHPCNWGLPEPFSPSSWLLRLKDDTLDTDTMKNILSFTKDEGIGMLSTPAVFDVDHHCIGYTKIFKTGINGILENIKRHIDTLPPDDEKLTFLLAAQQSLTALLKAARRFADKADKLLDTAQKHEVKFLRMISDCARRIPDNPPKTFYEGLAMLCFVREAMASFEGIGISVVGHVDRLLEPLYQSDFKKGIINHKEAKDLLARWMLPIDIKFKLNETMQWAETSTCMELGGCDENGAVIWGDVTRMILEVHEEQKLLNPKLNCRYGSSSPDAYLNAVTGSMLRGHNTFAMYNDDIMIPSQVNQKRTLEEARLYVNGGCQEIMIEGVEHTAGAYFYVNMPLVLDLCLRTFDGQKANLRSDAINALPTVIESAKSFDDFYDQFMTQLKKMIAANAEWRRKLGTRWRNIHPCPMFSATIDGCIEKGLDYTAGGAKYNDGTICACGFSTVVDSLSAVKQAVFEENRMTLDKLKNILAADWEGYEPIRRQFINYPKFGRGESDADTLAARFAKDLSDFSETISNERGGNFRISFFVYGAYSYFAPFVHATPDGRKKGDLLSQGIAPSRVRPATGITDTIRSLGHIDFAKIGGISVLDAQMPIGAGLDQPRMTALLKAFALTNGPVIQPNFVSVEDLLDAKAHPEKHRDLMVRLYGLSVFFVTLTPEIQDEIISRNLYI